MDINKIKEQVLTIKLNLFKLHQEKHKAAINQLWERAAELRVHEKELSETYRSLKAEIINALEKYDLSNGNLKDAFILHELMFEFSPIDILDELLEKKNLKTIDDYTGIYLQTHRMMYQKMLIFLDEEYAVIKNEVRLSFNESDVNRILQALEKLKSIAVLLQRKL